MYRAFQIHLAALLLIAGLTGCAGLDKGADISDTSGLVEYMQDEGISMLFHGPVSDPEISTLGYEYTVIAGGLLRVFEYKSSGAALLDMTRIEGDRDLFTTPHVYRRSNLVVVYFGDDPRTQNALSGVLGSRVS